MSAESRRGFILEVCEPGDFPGFGITTSGILEVEPTLRAWLSYMRCRMANTRLPSQHLLTAFILPSIWTLPWWQYLVSTKILRVPSRCLSGTAGAGQESLSHPLSTPISRLFVHDQEVHRPAALVRRSCRAWQPPSPKRLILEMRIGYS